MKKLLLGLLVLASFNTFSQQIVAELACKSGSTVNDEEDQIAMFTLIPSYDNPEQMRLILRHVNIDSGASTVIRDESVTVVDDSKWDVFQDNGPSLSFATKDRGLMLRLVKFPASMKGPADYLGNAFDGRNKKAYGGLRCFRNAYTGSY